MRIIIGIFLIVYAGFYSNGIEGALTNLKSLVSVFWQLLIFLNATIVKITGDGILTNFFLHYIVYALVGLLFEFFSIKKGCFGKLFGKVSYWIIGIPVSIILNYLSLLFFG